MEMLCVANEMTILDRDAQQIGKCAEEHAGEDCGFVLGILCEQCSVWIEKNVPQDCVHGCEKTEEGEK